MLDNLNSNFESSKAQRPDANDDEVEIDLLEIFYALKKKILLVLMVALVGGCIAAAYTQFLMTPKPALPSGRCDQIKVFFLRCYQKGSS